MEKNGGSLSVTNVVPRQAGSLSRDQYNAILAEFHERFVVPAAKITGANIEITADEKGIDAWLSAEAAEKLRRFSTAANKITGSSHPSDKDRWFSFILAAHEGGSELDPTTLSRWLIETERWSESVAGELTVEYEFGRELLAFEGVRTVDR